MSETRRKFKVPNASGQLPVFTMPADRLVGVNERGNRVGEDHQRSVLTDHEVDLLRAMYEAYPVGDPRHWGYWRLAKKFGISKTAVRKICHYSIRWQRPVIFKRVPKG
jgi:hypothetical protein